MNGGYEKAMRESLPDAQVCFDPFHVVQLAGRAVDDVRRAEWNTAGKSKTGHGRWVKGLRWSLLKAPEKQTVASSNRSSSSHAPSEPAATASSPPSASASPTAASKASTARSA